MTKYVAMIAVLGAFTVPSFGATPSVPFEQAQLDRTLPNVGQTDVRDSRPSGPEQRVPDPYLP